MQNDFKILDDREHILKRPAIYIGAIDRTEMQDFIVEDDKMIYKNYSVSPALCKIINEIIDNSIDEAIKTNFKYANQIDIEIYSDHFIVSDNGRGIPVVKHNEGYQPYLCWARPKAGSNFNDDSNRTQIGMNGVGSACTNIFSKKFIGITDDGNQKYKVIFENNNTSFKETLLKSSKNGTYVECYPDLERFKVNEIDQEHINAIYQRVLCLANIFTDIKFKFNKKLVKVRKFQDFVNLFNTENVVYDTEDVKIGITSNDSEDFRHFSYVNGLKIPDGGIHIDTIMYNVVNIIREKLVKKYKSIKPGDIKNKLQVVVFMKNFKNPKFNSQTKEKLTNSIKEFNEFSNIDYSFVNKILKNPKIIDPIIEIYKIKEEFKNRQELKALDKSIKKVKSEKYTPAIGSNDMLMICEGYSAMSGIQRCIGRKGIAYYELRGKVLNVCDITNKKFAENKELSELYKIIKNENFKKIVITSDADLDGTSIAGLLLNYLRTYHPDILSNKQVFRLNTPVGVAFKSNKLVDWCYSLDEIKNLKGDRVQYQKGLGSWNPEHMKIVIQKDTINKMLMSFDYSELDNKVLDEWYLSSNSDIRKSKIIENNFSLIKL